jgi:signal peptidase II
MSESLRDSADAAHSGSGAQAGPRAWTSAAAWVLFLVPAVLGLAGDLWLKSWAFPEGVPGESSKMAYAGRNPGIDLATGLQQKPWPVIPNVLGFTTTVNQGAVFGIGQGKVSLFLGFSLIALAIIVWVFVTSGAKQRVVHFALGLITAGAIGNLFDRGIHHGVRDMLQFNVKWYPYIFNLADVLLCVGVPLLILRWMFVKDDVKGK